MLYQLSYTPVLIGGASSDKPYLSTPFKWQAGANAGRHHTGPQANDKLWLSNDKLWLSNDKLWLSNDKLWLSYDI